METKNETVNPPNGEMNEVMTVDPNATIANEETKEVEFTELKSDEVPTPTPVVTEEIYHAGGLEEVQSEVNPENPDINATEMIDEPNNQPEPKVIQMEIPPQPVKEYPKKPISLPSNNGYVVQIKANALKHLFEIFKKLGSIPAAEPGGKWGYFVMRNAQKVMDQMRGVDKKIMKAYPQETPRQKDYLELELALFTEYSEKDENNNPIMEGLRFKIDDKRTTDFETAIADLRKVYSDVMERYESTEKVIDEINKEICIIEEPYLMYSSNLPQGLTPAEQEFIDPFIIEN